MAWICGALAAEVTGQITVMNLIGALSVLVTEMLQHGLSFFTPIALEVQDVPSSAVQLLVGTMPFSPLKQKVLNSILLPSVKVVAVV